MSDYLLEFLDGVVGVVEATSYEIMCLWHEYHEQRKVSWVQGRGGGYLPTIGELDGRPVCVSLFVNTIDGHKILFIDATSQVVDHRMIDEWLKTVLPATAFQEGGKYINYTNAMNFHNILPRKP
jgi:hypothetical protein